MLIDKVGLAVDIHAAKKLSLIHEVFEVMVMQFEVGKTYSMQSWHGKNEFFTVKSRSTKFIQISVYGDLSKVKIQTENGVEFVQPFKKYSDERNLYASNERA